MTVLSDALQWLRSRYLEATVPVKVGEDDFRSLYATSDGLIESPKNRRAFSDQLSDPREIGRWLELHEQAATVFVGTKHVEAVLHGSGDNWFDRAFVQLKLSDPFCSLIKMQTKQTANQKAMVLWLRRYFGDCEAAKILASKLRRVDFTRAAQVKGSFDHGRESLGRSVESAVQSTEDLPESVVLECHVWDIWPSMVSIRCLFVVDAEEQGFSIIPLAGEIERAEVAAVSQLRDALQPLLPAGTYAVLGER